MLKLDNLKGKYVKVLCRDGDKFKAIYGYLENFDEEEIELKRNDGRTVVIKREDISRIVEWKNDRI